MQAVWNEHSWPGRLVCYLAAWNLEEGGGGQQIVLAAPNGRNVSNWFKTFFGEEEEEEDMVWRRLFLNTRPGSSAKRAKGCHG